MQALHCKAARDCKVNAYWEKFASDAEQLFLEMCRADRKHPFVLQGFVQCSMLLQSTGERLGDPFDLEWDAM